jgi:hypothetical protein
MSSQNKDPITLDFMWEQEIIILLCVKLLSEEVGGTDKNKSGL